MSVLPRNCEVFSTSLPELFNLRLIESQYSPDPQLGIIYQLIKSKDPETVSKIFAMDWYYAQFVNDFHIEENWLWMDDKLVIPNSLHKSINNRLH